MVDFTLSLYIITENVQKKNSFLFDLYIGYIRLLIIRGIFPFSSDFI